MQVIKTASLHELTVKQAAVIKYSSPRQAWLKSTNSQVSVLKVDKRVWQTAMKLAGGKVSRIQVIHQSEVIVW